MAASRYRPRMKRWCFTLNNWDKEDLDEFYTLEECVKFGIAGEEKAPGTGTPHLQGFLHLKASMYLTGMQKLFKGRAHWEPARGSDRQNEKYCRKGGDKIHVIGRFDEGNGRMRQSYEDQEEEGADRWMEAKELAIANQVDLIEPQVYVKHYQSLKRIAQDHPVWVGDLDGDLLNIWIWGPPGTGKSRFARFLTSNQQYDKNANKWWCGYMGEQDIIIDDFGKSARFVVMGDHLKIWADRYRFRGETKGSSVLMRPKRIIVTSNYPPNEVFTEDEMLRGAIERRFKVVHMHEEVQPGDFQQLAELHDIAVVEISEKEETIDSFTELAERLKHLCDDEDDEVDGPRVYSDYIMDDENDLRSHFGEEAIDESVEFLGDTTFRDSVLRRCERIHPAKAVDTVFDID